MFLNMQFLGTPSAPIAQNGQDDMPPIEFEKGVALIHRAYNPVLKRAEFFKASGVPHGKHLWCFMTNGKSQLLNIATDKADIAALLMRDKLAAAYEIDSKTVSKEPIGTAALKRIAVIH